MIAPLSARPASPKVASGLEIKSAKGGSKSELHFAATSNARLPPVRRTNV
jgi:hypothetical protein